MFEKKEFTREIVQNDAKYFLLEQNKDFPDSMAYKN